MVEKIRFISYLIRYMGIRWCLFRVWYALKLKGGWFRWRCPARSWAEVEVGGVEEYLKYRRSKDAPRFLFSPEDREKFQPLFAQWDEKESPIPEAEAILRGVFRFFSKTEKEVGFPPNWHRNHFTGEQAPTDVHWSRLPDFGFGDIKNIWELSRFGWAYTLVRAYWRTEDERYAEAFWKLFEDWVAENPPNLGVNWKCGQEISFRVMAWCFAMYGFLGSAATTDERLQLLLKAIAQSGDRVAANITYAISQKNNHGISEGMGLWTVGILFPELKQAGRWREKGRKVLEQLARELIYEDGSFSQHSMNYHRVMLHDYLWAIRVGEMNGFFLSDELKKKVAAAVAFLWECQDRNSGHVPLFGSNDGALILPLTNSDYRDFRPVLTAAGYLAHGALPAEAGPWEETLLWFWEPDALKAERLDEKRARTSLTETGYLRLRDADTFLFSRAGPYCHRPSEADILHFDLWWKGQMIAGDAGTYSYNTSPPFDGALKRTDVHNTVSVDGCDQMEKAGRFLWLPWPRGSWRPLRENTGIDGFEGWHNGYHRLEKPVEHRRSVARAGEGAWVVIDRLESAGEHDYVLQWLLGDFPVTAGANPGTFRLETAKGDYFMTVGSNQGPATQDLSLVMGSSDSARGWRSAYYQNLEAAPSLQLRQTGFKVTFVTAFAPHPVWVSTDPKGIHVEFEHRSFFIGSYETTFSSAARDVESSDNIRYWRDRTCVTGPDPDAAIEK